MPLSASQVERAFVATAREQLPGEPFNWRRLAMILNAQLARGRKRSSAFAWGREP